MDLLIKNASKSDMPDYDYGYGISNVYKAYLSAGPSSVKVIHDGINNHVIYLNPAGELCIRNLYPVNDQYTLMIHNSFGKMLIKKTQQSKEDTINISSLQKGVYLISVQGKNDIYTCKIIK
jgi:hypothetical protein